MVKIAIDQGQNTDSRFVPSWSSRNVDASSSLRAQVIYYSEIMQNDEQLMRYLMMNGTAYKMVPAIYSFFSQRTFNNETVAFEAKQRAVVTDIHEQFNNLHRFFQFRKTEWAQIFGVSRVTIYGWLDKSMEPSGANKKRIEQLYQILCEVTDRTSKDTIQLYVHHHIAKLNASLFEVLSSNNAFMEQRDSIIQGIGELLERSRRKKQELDRLTETKKPSDATLAYNLDTLFS
ncbi:MAG: hypothetical protein GX260_04760 [Tissierellia bacterium]|nr:hypothetical protein [Tissierellia bacterium]